MNRIWLRLVIVSIITLSGVGLGSPADGQTVTTFEKRVIETITRVQSFHNQVESMQRFPGMTQKKRELYTQLASQLSPPAEYAHIKFPTDDPNREWVRHASRIARGLKPNINYLVKKGGSDTVITGSDAAIQNLFNNVKMIAWYHDELDKQFSDVSKNHGSVALSQLIDEYLKTLSDALPQIKIRKRGRINIAKDQELKYSEKKLWQLLSVINRYFFYKIQINDDRKDFYAADFLLMNSLIQTAAIYGAEPPTAKLGTLDIEFRKEDKGWKSAAYEALDSWERELNGEFPYPQTLCVIKIPAKPKPKPPAPKPPPKKDAFPSDVEDIKEIGGQIFIKRKGHWHPWEKK